MDLVISLDVRDTWGYTPLIIAMKVDCESVVRVLLDFGVDRTAVDNDGQSIWDLLALKEDQDSGANPQEVDTVSSDHDLDEGSSRAP